MRFRRNVKRMVLLVGLLVLVPLVAWPVYNTRVLTIKHEEVRIKSGDVELAATVSMPRWGSEPLPALVSVHGSGQIRRQDLRQDWRSLVPHGIVVLTYDKRGVGESSGPFQEVRLSSSEEQLRTLANDAVACFEYLKKHPRVDPKRVGFLGGSQAGWIVPLASDARSDVAFNIIFSGASTSYGIEMYYSSMTGDGRRPAQGLTAEEIEKRLESYDGPTGFDPLPVLRRMRAPTLWLMGGRDLSVPVQRTTRNLEASKLHGAPLTITVYPNGGHNLHDVDTGTRLPYWQDTVDWLRNQGILK